MTERQQRILAIDDNAYTLRLVNKDDHAHRFAISLSTKAPLQLTAPAVILAAPEEVITVPVTVRAAAGAVHGRADLRFVVHDLDTGLSIPEDSRFFGPASP